MKYQWMGALCLLAVIPLLTLVYVTVTASRYGIETRLPKIMENSLISIGDSLDLAMAKVENQMTAIAGSASIRDGLSKLESSPFAGVENQLLKSSLAGWLEARVQKEPLIARIMILGNEETSVNCTFDRKHSYQKAAGSKWYSQVPSENGKFLWIGSHPQLDAPARVNYSMSCLMRLTGRYILIVDVAAPPVSGLLSQKLIPGGGGTYLIDPRRQAVAGTTVKGRRGTAEATKRRRILEQFLKSNTHINRPRQQRPVVKSLAEITSTKVGYYPLARPGWVLVSVISGPEYQTTTGFLVWILILSGFILAAALIAAGLFFTNRITNRLTQVINAFRQAEAGNLNNLNNSLSIRSRDETGTAAAGYQTMSKNFTLFLAGIRELSERQNNVANIMTAAFKEVAATITDVLNIVRDVAGSAAKQSDETSGLSGFINELAEKVDSITSNIKSIREIGLNTQDLTVTGIGSIETLNQNVSKSNVITLSISEHLNVLNEETNQITEMISSIHEIADRNNILALNSLISAAKAGESGRGFSVVANNVKKLAERSMIVTREISDFISGLQKRMVATAEAASNIGATVEAQNQAFKESILVFNRINTVTNHLTGRFTEIVKLVDDMEANKTETLNSMNSISFRTRQIAAMMGEIKTSLERQLTNIADLLALAKELKKVSYRLQQTIKDYKIA